MTAYTRTIRVSDAVFQRISQLATAQQQTIDEMADEALRRTLPPSLEKIPERFRTDLQQLATMSDSVLWRVSRVELDDLKATRYETLLQENAEQSLTPERQGELSELREEADLLMFRRAYALVLLKERGHSISLDA